jgi:CRISPR/Cas system-associated exonuclease Cas4 (RecB family)
MNTATRGTATPRKGKPYIHVTWLAKVLGGARCLYSPWFKAHYQHTKYEEQAADLAKWNADHTKLMNRRRAQLERDGWTVSVEDQNEFRLEGEAAIVAGKMDLVAVKGEEVLVVDGKTGRERESDIWQVLIYLYALPKARKDLPANLEGEVHYKGGDVSLTPSELTPERRSRMVDLIKTIASDTPPPKYPVRDECRFCSIGFGDCPERVGPPKTTQVGDF